MKNLRRNIILSANLIIFLFTPSILKSQSVQAVSDTIDLFPGIAKTVNLLGNDTIPLGDSIKVVGGYPGNASLFSINSPQTGFYTYLVKPLWGYNNELPGSYTIIDLTNGQISTGSIWFRVHDHSFDSLEINNVSATITAFGNQFFLPALATSNTRSFYRVPKDGSAGTIFNLVPWIGGKDAGDVLYFAGERYRQGPNGLPAGQCPDFSAGPVMDSINYSVNQDTLWYRTWKIKKTDVEYHRLHWNSSGYVAPLNIRTWPAEGNTAAGQAAKLAPFHDTNLDGHYNPSDGDYPNIPGDEAIFAIFNDDRQVHAETGGKKLKTEVHLMAYAFNIPGDTVFNNTIFLRFKFFNRSDVTYFNSYLGIFTDFDLGSSSDDYTGCDVERNSFFVYNGFQRDGQGQTGTYGMFPPAQAVTILKGPLLDPVGTDRPKTDQYGNQLCNESVNGTGFGDGIADNEHYGLGGFVSFTGSGQTGFMANPIQSFDYYRYLKSEWYDSVHLFYGGLGHPDHGGYGPDCRFLFPGESDTLNWGTSCQQPAGLKNWTARTGGGIPGDYRGVGATGPFTFEPGEEQTLELALVFARDMEGSDSLYPSLDHLRKAIDRIRNSYNSGTLPNGEPFEGIADQPARKEISIFPNPARDLFTLSFGSDIQEILTISILDMQGVRLRSERKFPDHKTISIHTGNISPGAYLIEVNGKDIHLVKKLMITR